MKTRYQVSRGATEVGYLQVGGVFGGQAIITMLMVKADCRSQGFGSSLMADICRDADAEGVTLTLDVAPDPGREADLLRFYSRFDFIARDALASDVIMVRQPRKPGIKGATIVLRSGRYLDFLKPDPAVICIEDIAWGLAYTCRFASQCLAYYSVAQHSVLVSENVPPEHALAALLHDAAEAYVGDVVSPMKQLMPEYKAIEKRVEAAVAERFGIPVDKHPSIKDADLRLLRTEQRDLTAAHGDTWAMVQKYPPLEQVIRPLEPTAAAMLFLGRFEDLFLEAAI